MPLRRETIEPSGSVEFYLRRHQWFDLDRDFERLLEVATILGDRLRAKAKSPRKPEWRGIILGALGIGKIAILDETLALAAGGRAAGLPR